MDKVDTLLTLLPKSTELSCNR